jgi:hypothetical protein
MQNWLRTLIAAISLALMATTAMHVAAHGMIHAGMPHQHCTTQPDNALADEGDAGAALPALVAIHCSTVALPQADTIERAWHMQPVAWIALPVLEPAGRSPALDPQPPRL